MVQFSPPRLVTEAEYRRTPWKNGKGWTNDILLLPEGSSHETFDIRISLAPIPEEGPFSSFPGIERTITRLTDTPLGLTFDDGRTIQLEKLQPIRFDSGLAPRSVLPDGGAARVLNVMCRRTLWRSDARTAVGAHRQAFQLAPGEMLALYLAQGHCTYIGHGGAQAVRAGETVLSSDPWPIALVGDEDCEAIIAIVSPVERRL